MPETILPRLARPHAARLLIDRPAKRNAIDQNERQAFFDAVQGLQQRTFNRGSGPAA